MRVCVACDIEIGSHRAHAINVIKTAGGFTRLGHEVRVLCRASPEVLPRQAAVMYAEPDLHVELAPVLSPAERECVSRARQEWFGRWVGERVRGADVVYARHFAAGLAAARLGLPVAIETHAHVGDDNPLLQQAILGTREAVRALITISPVLREHYVARGAEPSRVHVVPDGVDLALFTPPAHLPPPPWPRDAVPHAVYCGHLYPYKGIPAILAAAALRPQVQFEIVGGAEPDLTRTRAAVSRAGLANVRVHGWRPHADVPVWLWHADVLLLPPSAGDPSAAWTSPVKLGEYLAAGPPIVASDIPGLRVWVCEPAVRWCRPDDPADLARAIDAALAESPAQACARRCIARQFARRYAYPARARAILHALGVAADGVPGPAAPAQEPCS